MGQNPGADEDRSGIPFVGAAGKLFNRTLLPLAGLTREQVFVTNLMKCKTPGNRPPTEEEVRCCVGKHLEAEIALVKPAVILAMGAPAAEWFLPGVKISKVHGIPHRRGAVVILPVYHPAAMLHTRELTAMVESDFRRVPEALALAEAADVAVVVVDDLDAARRAYGAVQ